jgi:parallel beta-helix repeat protein
VDAPQPRPRRFPLASAILLVAATAILGFSVGYGLGAAAPPVPGAGPSTAPRSPGPSGATGPGAVVEVRADGDDAARGDAAAPWRTLAHALASVAPGSTIRVGPGTFEAAEVTVPGTRIVGSGPATVITGGLVVRADGVEVSDLALTGQAKPYAGGITVAGASGVVIARTLVSGNPFGVYLDNAPGALVEDSRITGNGYGIEIHGTTGGTRISGNEIVDNDRPLDDARGAGGINLYFTTGGVTISGNRIEGNKEVAIEIYAAADVVIDDNRVSGSSDMIETGTEDGTPCANLVITRNTFFDAEPDDPREVRGVYLRCATDALIEWNTFHGLDRFALGLYAGSGGFNGPLERVTIRHNILAGGRAYSLDSALPASVTIDQNVVLPCRTGACPVLGRDIAFVASAGSGTRVWAEFQGWTGYDANGRFGDPAFVDAAAGDFRLAAGSGATGLAGVTEAPVPGTSAAP